MFFAWFIIAMLIVGLLSWFGAWFARRSPGTSWQSREDHPIIPGDH